MKKKGFTLVELLAVIIILAIIIVMAVPTYNMIKNNMEKRSEKNFITYLELQAEKFITNEQVISEVDEFDISVQNLLDYGYIKKNDTDLKKLGTDYECMIIHIKVKGDKVEAKYKNQRDCNLEKAIYLSKIVEIEAYDYETKEQIKPYGDPNSKVLYNPNLNWTNHDVVLILKTGDASESKINKDNITEVAWSGPNLEETRTNKEWLEDINDYRNINYRNAIKITPETIMNDTTYRVNATIQYENQNGVTEVDYVQTYIIVRIDKEKPVVTAHVSDIVKDEFLKSKTIYITGNDFEGSGIDYFCINTERTENCSDPSARISADKNGRATVDKPNGTYYIWAVDKVGNISKDPAVVSVKKVDDVPPRCIIEGENDTWTNQPVQLEFICQDDESGCVETSSVVVDVDEEGETYDSGVVFHDNAGNTVVCDLADVYIDRTKPSCEVNAATTSTTWAKSRSVEVKCKDGMSGCTEASKTFKYGSLTGDSSLQYVKVASYDYTITDQAGNSTKCSKNANVYVDNVDPEIAINNPSIPVVYKEGTTLNTTITLTDNNQLAGYKITNSATVPSDFTPLSSTRQVQTEAISKIGKFYVHLKDVAGNITTKSYEVNCPFTAGQTYYLNGENYGYGLTLNTDLCGGNFTFTLYGAQGTNNGSGKGGYGAKTVGTMTVNKKEKRYIYIGTQGTMGHETYVSLYYGGSEYQFHGNYIGAGSFNGGGYSSYGMHGGGATDIRTVSGPYYDYTSLHSRIMVAAGGGGASPTSNGGYGGTTKGGDAAVAVSNHFCCTPCINNPPVTNIVKKSCCTPVYYAFQSNGNKAGECFSVIATGGSLTEGGYYGASTHYNSYYYGETTVGWWNGLPGEFGLGGWGNGSGGGGGGWYGGGGGSAGANNLMSGGGGSSCISANDASFGCQNAKAEYRFTNPSWAAAQKTGHGQAVIYVNSVIE